MKLAIDIPEDKYDLIRMAAISGLGDFTYKIIANGTPIPDDEQAEWIDDKCSVCGKGIEDLIDSPEWYRNEEPNFCPFCGKKFKEKGDTYSFPEVFGEPIEMLIDGVWVRGKVINNYRSRDGIVNMETADGKKYWCGCERTDCYRKPKED